MVIRGEIEDSEYAMIFLRDITEAKVESARHLQMAADNASMEQIIQSIVRLVDRFVVCDLENDRYKSYTLNGQRIYKPLGFYHDWQMQVLEKYKTLEPLEAIDILIAPDNIRKKLKMIFISLSTAAWMKRLIKSLLIFPWNGRMESWKRYCWHPWM